MKKLKWLDIEYVAARDELRSRGIPLPATSNYPQRGEAAQWGEEEMLAEVENMTQWDDEHEEESEEINPSCQ
jgi:hypothetical protein